MGFQIRFHDVAHSDVVRAEAERLADELQEEFPDLLRLDLSINRSGEDYETQVHATGKSIDLVGAAAASAMRDAVIEAFDRARRQLRKHHDKVLDRRR